MHAVKKLFPQSLKNIYHLLKAIFANVVYGFPSRKINVIGVTGTNGKTTTTQMIAKILEEAGKRIAVASTINFKIGDKEWINTTKYTTLSPFSVQKFIKQAVAARCEYLVLETSSHSLDQHRVWGVRYQTAVITNVTREHLDYHKTIELYRKAKEKLFKIVGKNNGTTIVNLDMENPEDFLKHEAKKKYGHTTNGKHSQMQDIELVKAENIELNMHGTKYEIQNIRFNLQIPGLFNVENALVATCVGVSEGISLETISKALEKIKGVPGRFEFVQNDKGINIIVDYAVTPDSLLKLYELIGHIKQAGSKTISVFGSCGERDRGKRPIMGEIVSENADFVIVTNEDPYGENPVDIINEVFGGVVGLEVKGELPIFQFPINTSDLVFDKQKKEGVNCWRIMNRREAIREAIGLARKGDMVVVTGKGAEETMAIGKERISWNDKKVILEELAKL